MIRLVLLGAPGSGKGTMGDLLERDFGYLKISTGDMIREEVGKKTALGDRMKKIMDSGELVPDPLIIEMVRSRLAEKKDLKGYLLDGFPRTLAQAKSLAELPADRELALLLDVPEDELVRRLTSRLTCGRCGAIYNLNNLPPREENVCDRCAGSLVRRSDDSLETIRQRIRVYHEQTEPVIEYFRRRENLVTVAGRGKPDEVYMELKKALP